MTEPRVTIVIVTYQSEATIDEALAAGRAAHEAGLARYVVVDNASSDGTVGRVRERYPWVRLIESGANVGFARGCNLGAKGAGTSYLLFLNPDAIMEAGAIEALADFLDGRPTAGIAGPAIRRADGGWHHVGGPPSPGRMIRKAIGWERGEAERRTVVGGQAPLETDWVCGAALMIRRPLFEELGGFDPRFFLYFDETDLCRRAMAKGAGVWAVGEAVARHAGGHSVEQVEEAGLEHGCIAEHFFASRYYYLVKHHGWLAAVTAESVELAGRAARDLLRPLLRRPGRQELSHRLQGPLFRLPQKPRQAC